MFALVFAPRSHAEVGRLHDVILLGSKPARPKDAPFCELAGPVIPRVGRVIPQSPQAGAVRPAGTRVSRRRAASQQNVS